MKKVMILGAGIYQVPLINKAKEMGLHTIVVSPKGPYPGIELADTFLNIDTTDQNKILEKAIELDIDGILTTGTDVAMPSIGYVNDNLNLSGVSHSSAIICSDKIKMKQAFLENNVKTAEFRAVSSLSELNCAAQEIGFPVIIKAIDSSGSRGITKVDSEQDLLEAFNSALSVSKTSNVIIEKFLVGYEIGAQCVVVGDEVKTTIFHNDLVTPPPICVPYGHSLPLELKPDLTRCAEKEVEAAIKSLKIESCVANVDLMICQGVPYIIEIGARMGATCLPENMSIYTGLDFYTLLISLSLGIRPEIPSFYAKTANTALLIRAESSGVIKSIKIPQSVTEHPNLVDISLDYNVGDYVKKFKVGPDRIGQLIVTGSTSKESDELALSLIRSIEIEVEP